MFVLGPMHEIQSCRCFFAAWLISAPTGHHVAVGVKTLHPVEGIGAWMAVFGDSEWHRETYLSKQRQKTADC